MAWFSRPVAEPPACEDATSVIPFLLSVIRPLTSVFLSPFGRIDNLFAHLGFQRLHHGNRRGRPTGPCTYDELD